MKIKLKCALASIALLVAGGAQAAIVDGTTGNKGSDIVISIFNTATSESALIDTNLNAVTLAGSPGLYTFTDPSVTSFLGASASAAYVFSVIGIQGNNATQTGLDYGTLVTKVGAGIGPTSFTGLSSTISNISGDFGDANADPNFSSVDVATGLTSGSAFHSNITSSAASFHTWNIEALLDTPIEFAWTHLVAGGATTTQNLGYWGISSATGLIVFDTTAASVQSQLTPSAVPVPAAVWLFGSGFMGLVGVARRRKI